MASRRREELSDISTTELESCLHASSLHLETIPVLSNPVLSFSLFSPATYHRFHFPDSDMKNAPKPTKPPVFEHTQAHKGVTGREGWKEQKSRKENNEFIWF